MLKEDDDADDEESVESGEMVGGNTKWQGTGRYVGELEKGGVLLE